MSSATAIRGNSIYTVVDGTSWTQAEANSTKLGGHLATINNADERRWLSENVYGNKTHIDRLKSNAQIISELDGYFIGLNDKASNGIFQWAGGGVVEWADPSEYIHPAYYADQGYLIDGFDYGAVHSNSDGLTPDIGFSLGDTHSYYANDGIFYRGIAETLFIRWKDSAYVAVQGPTWEEAEANAAKLGGHLVTINDTGENNFLVERGFKGWIGLTDKQTEGTWEWSSGEPFSLEEWIQNIFNRDDAPPLGQDYVYLDDDQEGAIQWDSVHPSQVSIGGIAEIKLAPNNQPTGAPALSGIFKAGQVISIDRTLLQDADNFAGYNPGFRYFWEVSTDGNTWSRLISADAVDSDTTYTLTSTEVGKQIRGIVSYLDGHGTQESVASNSSIIVTQENRPPTDLSLSSGGIAENSYAGSLVGTLSAIDADADSSFTYDLVAGNGSNDADNNLVEIVNSNEIRLKPGAAIDFESNPSLQLNVRVTDNGTPGLTLTKAVTVNVLNVQEEGSLDAITSSIEGVFQEGVNLTAGVLNDPDTILTTPTYTWHRGTTVVQVGNSKTYAVGPVGAGTYWVEASYTDGTGSIVTASSTSKLISKINNGTGTAPTITSSHPGVLLEGVTLTAGAITGDPDGDGHTDAYQWYKNGVAIAGAVSASLNTTATGVGAYSVAVSYTDGQGYSETLLSSSVDVAFNSSINHAPTDLLTSATSFNENIAAGTTVATLSSTDPDTADTFTYTLVGGTDSIDNTAFSINNNQLRINASPNFEAKSSYSIRLRATDNAGLHFEKPVTLTVNDLTETVTSLVTTFLAYDKDILQLTGSRHVFGTGNAKDNTIIGNSGRNGLTGGLGKDTLTGGGGVDTFIYSARNESLLSGFDVITDYASGELISCYFETRGNRITSSRGTLDALNESSIQQLLDPTFQAHTVDAFQVKGYNGCFVAINDNRDGFQAATDSIIHLSNYALGSDNPIAIF